MRIPRPVPIFVFGSNLAGRHGKGAALWARRHRGAIYGQGTGRQGDSYAIPTKDARLQVLALPVIAAHVAAFLAYADRHPGVAFELTPIGCGLAGYRPDQIAPLSRTPHATSVATGVQRGAQRARTLRHSGPVQTGGGSISAPPDCDPPGARPGSANRRTQATWIGLPLARSRHG